MPLVSIGEATSKKVAGLNGVRLNGVSFSVFMYGDDRKRNKDKDKKGKKHEKIVSH